MDGTVLRQTLLGLTGVGVAGTCIAAARDTRKAPRPLPAPSSDFLTPDGMAYLNCATLGPTPRCVIDAVVQEWKQLEADPLNGYFGGGQENSTTRMEYDAHPSPTPSCQRPGASREGPQGAQQASEGVGSGCDASGRSGPRQRSGSGRPRPARSCWSPRPPSRATRWPTASPHRATSARATSCSAQTRSTPAARVRRRTVPIRSRSPSR